MDEEDAPDEGGEVRYTPSFRFRRLSVEANGVQAVAGLVEDNDVTVASLGVSR